MQSKGVQEKIDNMVDCGGFGSLCEAPSDKLLNETYLLRLVVDEAPTAARDRSEVVRA